MNKSYFNRTDSTQTHVYLAFFIPDVKVKRIPTMQSYAEREGWPDTEDESGVWTIPIYPDQSMEENVKNSILSQSQHFFSLAAQHPARTKIYIVARQNEGEMTWEIFEKTAKKMMKILQQNGINTENMKQIRKP